ncbi:acyltransferase [Paraconexibacter antarcticus]|uniref:Acyltransferase n=1 Tax=Paraconexibacter antarcticus TaxID=2949664 RepID=A0ABY5DMS9_9ACTN|nr:acyltransferase [Paraconexibacter antarcticus]UTI62725.1 acyltransferase [Paraconexibacter antarcticus]
MTAVLELLRALRFRVWALGVRLRLRRLGGALVLDVAAPPRLRGLPHVDIDGFPGTLTLRIGRDVQIGRDLVLDLAAGVDGEIVLGDGVTLQDGVRLQPWGGRIEVQAGAQVRDRCELKSTGDLRLGARCVLSRTATLHCHERIHIGARCAIAERTTIIDSDHGFDGSDTFVLEQPVRSAPITVGENVFVGTNVVILRGTTVGDRAVVAAGAVLNGGDFPAAHIVAGVPARTLRPLG